MNIENMGSAIIALVVGVVSGAMTDVLLLTTFKMACENTNPINANLCAMAPFIIGLLGFSGTLVLFEGVLKKGTG
jgi:hypothetical protein